MYRYCLWYLGLDQEMPSDDFFGESLLQAVQSGQVSESTFDDKVSDPIIVSEMQKMEPKYFYVKLLKRSFMISWASNIFVCVSSILSTNLLSSLFVSPRMFFFLIPLTQLALLFVLNVKLLG